MPRPNKGPRLELGVRNVWEIRFTENGRSRRYSTGTPDLAAAQKALAEFLLKEGEADAAGMTVADVLELWYERHGRHKAGASTLALYKKHLIAHMGSTPVERLRADQIDGPGGYLERRVKAGCVPGTVRTELAILSAAFNWCHKRELISRKPFIPLPPPSPPRERWFTPDEVELLLTEAAKRRTSPAVPTRAELFMWLAVKTAARERSICRLEWRHVDLDACTIDFRPYYTTKRKRGALVPIAAELLPILQAEQARATTPYVLRTTAGLRATIYRIADAAKVEGVSPHIFRHTYASQALQSGVPIERVAQVMGDTIATVERVYGKWRPSSLQDAVDFDPRKPRRVA